MFYLVYTVIVTNYQLQLIDQAIGPYISSELSYNLLKTV